MADGGHEAGPDGVTEPVAPPERPGPPDEAGPAARRRWARDHRADIALGLLLGLAAAAGVFAIAAGFGREHWTRNDFWFDSDLNRIALTMADSEIPPLHTNVHPAFALFFNPVIRAVPFLSPFNRILIAMSCVTAAWVTTLYAILRLVGCRRTDAVVFTALASTSAAALFFSTIPETFPVGALTMLLVVLLVAVEEHRRVPAIAYVVAGAVAMGVTVTNGVVLVATQIQERWGSKRWKRAAVILAGAGLGVIALSLAQNALFPESQFVLDPGVPAGGKFEEGNYVLAPEAGGPVWIANAGLVTTMVAPELKTRPKEFTNERMMTFQRSAPGSGTPAGAVAALAWVALLAIGVWALFRGAAPRRFRLVVGFALLGQLAIHMFYGQEIFPYSMHFLPFLILTAAVGSLTRLRPYVLALAAVVLVAGLANNLHQLSQAHDLYRVMDAQIRAITPG